MSELSIATMEFHLSRKARERFQFDEALFSQSGKVVFANFRAARVFAQKINDQRDLARHPEKAARAGDINAMGMIDEILHMVVASYHRQVDSAALEKALVYLIQQIGDQAVEKTLRLSVEQFPPLAVYRGEVSVEDYMNAQSRIHLGNGVYLEVSNRRLILEELLMVWLINMNPACAPYRDLFDDADLQKMSAYPLMMDKLHDFFALMPPFGPDQQNLVDMLGSPALAAPHSLSAQLDYIRLRWGGLLGSMVYRLLSSLDLVREEEKSTFQGPGPARVVDFSSQAFEEERFSIDRDWMPNLVLIAKNTYVWLDQLSRKYQRQIQHLDDIPEEELATLARWGVTGLWLIGLWERSNASRMIKQLRGNVEAVASAYSLMDYRIAADLGGEEAYRTLRDRAWKWGIRLASDMVPNHMGIDSTWVIQHPDWFLSLDYSPYPSYTFNGPNLSWDNRVGIYLEDHYYDNSDAAVVFKRVDFWTGDQKFIYHGNDGTSMPWNDTAQLNYLKAEVREAVIAAILEVAHRFPIIRFDAAMTLAKKHYQRLWFPEPGTGGAIPSRAEHGLSRQQFDELFPDEFWRQVVDRVAQEAPDTLLLAEAFWLMEGYFVRTLGMHRVYNSAFMNMLRDEKNQEYRLVIKNTLEFDPEILKRYVNFMNNPDERTAVDQFGKGDKYFGVCILMATMPGLPMFGHGQVEGYTEKYGMEFRRPLWQEMPDAFLVERHNREIFPLLHKRYLFAEVANFLLYDLYSPEGYVNEDVFAYSNRAGSKRSLVVYHNRYAQAKGWLHTSVAYALKGQGGDPEERRLVRRSLGEGLALTDSEDFYTIFRDHISGLEFIRSSQELCRAGLYVELDAYQYRVYLDFREVQDDASRRYAQINAYLGGRGVSSIDEAMREILLRPVHEAFRQFMNQEMFGLLAEHGLTAKAGWRPELALVLEEGERNARELFLAAKTHAAGEGDVNDLAGMTRRELAAILILPHLGIGKARAGALDDGRRENQNELNDGIERLRIGWRSIEGGQQDVREIWGSWLGWLASHRISEVVPLAGRPQGILERKQRIEESCAWFDEWLLGKVFQARLLDAGVESRAVWRISGLTKTLINHQDWWQAALEADNKGYRLLYSLLNDSEATAFLGVNRYNDIIWFRKEAYEQLLWWLMAIRMVEVLAETPDLEKIWTNIVNGTIGAEEDAELSRWMQALASVNQVMLKLRDAEARSGYQVEKLLEIASNGD